MTKYIVGVDQSLRHVGVSVHDNTGKELETFDITSKPGSLDHHTIDAVVDSFFARLDKYMTNTVLNERALSVFYEDIIFGKHGKSTARAEIAGALKWNLRQQRIPIYGVHPNAAFSFLTKTEALPKKRLSTEERKQITMNLLHKNRNFYTTNDNMADAYVCAMYGYSYLVEGNRRLDVRKLC